VPACSLESIVGAALGHSLDLSDVDFHVLDEARSIYLREASGRRVYGYCTGLGDLQGRGGCPDELTVLREHAAGVGPAAHPVIVRGFLYVRLLQLAAGGAPVRGLVAERLADALYSDVVPVVPLYGSVGASGDLAPSAHAFLCLYYGEGEAFYRGERMPCSEALARAGLGRLGLERGEALALMNNTAWSTALASLGVAAGERAIRFWLTHAAPASMKEAGCVAEHYEPRLLARRHPGAARVAEALARAECRAVERLQDPYSLRCAPMVVGAALDVLGWARGVLEREACSPTENPTVHCGRVVHWCGFHAIYPAVAADAAAVALAHVAGLVDRRVAQLLRGEITGLPDYLAVEGSSVGAMLAQYTTAALAARSRWLASPASPHSIPTSGLQEDYVSMAPLAGLRLLELAGHVAVGAAIELAVAEAASLARAGGRPEAGRLVERALEAASMDPLLALVTSGTLTV